MHLQPVEEFLETRGQLYGGLIIRINERITEQKRLVVKITMFFWQNLGKCVIEKDIKNLKLAKLPNI